MTDAATYLAAALLIGFAGYLALPDRRGAHDPALRHVCVFALSVSASLLVLAPSSLGVLERHPGPGGGLAAAAVLLGAELKMAGLTALAFFARALDEPGPLTRRLGPQALAAMVLEAALFASARPRCLGGAAEAAGSGRWLLAVYDLLLLLYAVRCLLLFVTLMARHARRIEASGLRVGLKLMAAGGAVGVLWTLWLLSDALMVVRSGRQDSAEDAQSAVLALACAALAVGGATAAVWGRVLAVPLRVLRARRAHRRLEPLWSALYLAHPAIALPQPRRAGRPGLRQAEFALYRRVIEIHDGRLRLLPYYPPEAEAAVPGAAGTDHVPTAREAAAREAAALAAGLAARHAGAVPRPARPSVPAPRPGQPRSGSIDADLAWLLLVAEAFTGTAGDGSRPADGAGPDRGAREAVADGSAAPA